MLKRKLMKKYYNIIMIIFYQRFLTKRKIHTNIFILILSLYLSTECEQLVKILRRNVSVWKTDGVKKMCIEIGDIVSFYTTIAMKADTRATTWLSII